MMTSLESVTSKPKNGKCRLVFCAGELFSTALLLYWFDLERQRQKPRWHGRGLFYRSLL